VRNGRHVLCEKPLALNLADAVEMLEAAEAAGVRHMTAFTYRFVPAMRYMKRLVDDGFIGRPLHFRAQRFQDWGRRHLGWRQVMATAGSGELGDMLSHRIDYAHYLVGPIVRVVAHTKRLFETRTDGAGMEHASDVEDWVACLAEFEGGAATGVFESTKAAVGRGDGSFSRDWCELNGTEGSLVYRLERPHQLDVARSGEGEGLRTIPVPAELLKPAGSPRDVSNDEPLQGFRYDQDFEFLQAIREGRPCSPSFHDGVRVQAVMEAILRSARDGCWRDVPPTPAPPP
jgi:predicted dehydrogenase